MHATERPTMSADIRYDGDQAAIQEGETPPSTSAPVRGAWSPRWLSA
jgi:hypothetical protein